MLRETNVFGIFISPLVSYMFASLVLVLLRIQRWAWNVPLAETAIYVCILGALIRFA
jgi:hypothetical protein